VTLVPLNILRERLLARREISEGACWLWTGPCLKTGMATIYTGSRKCEYIHRVSYRIFNGPLTPNMRGPKQICGHKNCFNPEHLVDLGPTILSIVCEHCGKVFMRRRSEADAKRMFCSDLCTAGFRVGENNPNWRGGVPKERGRHHFSAEYLHRKFTYDPATGEFRWVSDCNYKKYFAGDSAGWVDDCGYLKLKIEGLDYFAHVIAFCMMTGEWPKDQVDHRDGEPGNLIWKNIRPATIAQNAKNKGLAKSNTSGTTGVNYSVRQGKWVVRIGVDGNRLSLGCFDNYDEARSVRLSAQKKFYGDFSRAPE
jgi:hypothetical protein